MEPLDAPFFQDRYDRYTRYPEGAWTTEHGLSIYPDGSLRICQATVYIDGRVQGADQHSFLQGEWTGSLYLSAHEVDLAAFGPVEGGEWNRLATVIVGHRWHGPANFLGFEADHSRLASLPQELVLCITEYVKESIADPYEFSKQALAIFNREVYRNKAHGEQTR